MIVNAEGQILGRMATFVAKQALLGNDIIVVNGGLLLRERCLKVGRLDSTCVFVCVGSTRWR